MQINSIQPKYATNKMRINRNNTMHQAPSFKGGAAAVVQEGAEQALKGLPKFYEKVAGNPHFQNFIQKFSKSNKTFTHVMVAESCFLSGFYMINTLRNKKIKKEQKPQMLINDALTLGVSTAGAYLVEDKINNLVVKGAEKYFTKNKGFYSQLGKTAQEEVIKGKKAELAQVIENVVKQGGDKVDDVLAVVGKHFKGIVGEKGKEKVFQISEDAFKTLKTSVGEAVKNNKGNVDGAKKAVSGLVDDVYNKVAARAEVDKTMSGINKLKVLVVFGIIYRYLGPVLITPLANKLSAKFFSHKEPKEAEKTQTTK